VITDFSEFSKMLEINCNFQENMPTFSQIRATETDKDIDLM